MTFVDKGLWYIPKCLSKKKCSAGVNRQHYDQEDVQERVEVGQDRKGLGYIRKRAQDSKAGDSKK